MSRAATFLRDGCGAEGLLRAAPAGIASAYAGILLTLFSGHAWILDAKGRPATSDFLAIWTTGKLAFAGRSASLYDPQFIHQAQIAVVGHSFPGYFFWNYPPIFIFVAMALAALPYAASFVGWIFVTGLAFAATVKAILCRWEGVLFACASPAILLNAYLGQTGFLTAALIGCFLLLLTRRPVMAGITLGLMTYKPQFGILIPVALVAGGYWRTILSAALTAASIAILAELAFGTATFVNFLHSLPVASRAYLTLGEEGWTKMESVYSVIRFLGFGDVSGWIAQGLTIVFCAIAMFALWKLRVDFALKAAGLVTASILSTPYVHVYDFPVLLIAMALLFQHRPFDRLEWCVLIAANIAIAFFLAQLAPLGAGIVAAVGGLVVRRVLMELAGIKGPANAALPAAAPAN